MKLYLKASHTGYSGKTLDFDFIHTVVFFCKYSFISYRCEVIMWTLTDLSFIMSWYGQIGGNKLECEIIFLGT